MSTNSIYLTPTELPDMQEVGEVIRDSLQYPAGPLQEMVDHLLQSDGKKLRPLLVMLSTGLFPRTSSPVCRDAMLQTAAAVELIHTASLVHDDIIDGAAQRRGNATLHRRWDDRSATLVGDHLLCRAFNLVSDLEQNAALLPLMARSVYLMCRGEVRQLSKSFDWEISEQEYFRCNYLKTSQFLAVCCEAGGQVALASSTQLKALREYGFNLGQAFQIVDDILDYTEDPDLLGKPVGSDLQQGVVTLPLIYALRKHERYRALLKTVTSRRVSLRPALQQQLRKIVYNSGALHYASAKARQAGTAARGALQELPSAPSRQVLDRMVEAVTGRIPVLD